MRQHDERSKNKTEIPGAASSGEVASGAHTGCTTNTTMQNSSGGGGGGNAGVAVAVNSQQTASQIGSGFLVATPKPGNQYLVST